MYMLADGMYFSLGLLHVHVGWLRVLQSWFDLCTCWLAVCNSVLVHSTCWLAVCTSVLVSCAYMLADGMYFSLGLLHVHAG